MNNYDQLVKDLKNKYGKSALTLKELASELGVSINTIRLGIRGGRGIPKYRKIGGGQERQTVIFPIVEVARFLANTEEVY